MCDLSIPCDETARDIKRRRRARNLWFGIEAFDQIPEFCSGISHPGIIEISGPSGSGKTETILQICANSILPSTFENLSVGGTQASMLIVTMGSTPGECLPRLISLLDLSARRAWVSALGPQEPHTPHSPPETWIENFVMDCLDRVHFVHCSNSLEFLAAAHCMEKLVESEPSLSGIAVDCISSYQWIDRVQEGSENASRLIEQGLSVIHKLTQKFHLCLFSTRRLPPPSGDSDAARRHMAADGTPGGGGGGGGGGARPLRRWEKVATARIVLSVVAEPAPSRAATRRHLHRAAVHFAHDGWAPRPAFDVAIPSA